MKKIGILCLFTLCFMFILISCGSPEENIAGGNNNVSDVTETTEVSEETTARYTLPEADFEGANVTFLSRDDGNFYWVEKDFYAEVESGEPFNDAVYTRNRIVEEKYNVNIEESRVTNVHAEARKQLLADAITFDVMVMTIQPAAKMAQEGFLMDLNELPHLQLDKPWWDEKCNTDMTINNKLFFSLGDINSIDNDATWVVLFNKDISESYGLAEHYELVNGNKWTLDKLHENCVKVTSDLNGDGLFTPEDQWGAVNQYECAYALLASAGLKSTQKTADDYPEISMNTPQAISVMEKIYAFMTDKTAQIKADDPAFSGKYKDIWTEINVNGFLESRALYYISPMCTVPFFRGMEQNFGLIPLPKYDEAQSEYYSPVQHGNATSISFPISGVDYDRVCLVVEMMAAESAETVTAAYYDINLKTKLTRDNESADMLDLIFAGRLFDLGVAFDWSGIQGFYQDVVKGASFNFVSLYESKETKILAEMQKSIDLFSGAA